MGIKELVRETVVDFLNGIFMWGTRLVTSPFISWKSRPRPSSSTSSLHGGGDDHEKKNKKGYSYAGLSIVSTNHDDEENDGMKTRLILKSSTAAAASATAKPSRTTSVFTLLPSELSSVWTKSTTGDFLGAESGVHMVSAGSTAAPSWGNVKINNNNKIQCRRKRRVIKNDVKSGWDIPPPLTWLLRRQQREYNNNNNTNNYVTTTAGAAVDRRLPYFLNREYINGRLVLIDDEVENFEHLQPTATAGGSRADTVVHVAVVGEERQEKSFAVTDDI